MNAAWTTVPDEVRANHTPHFGEKDLRAGFFYFPLLVSFVLNENVDCEWFGSVFVCLPPTVRHSDS